MQWEWGDGEKGGVLERGSKRFVMMGRKIWDEGRRASKGTQEGKVGGWEEWKEGEEEKDMRRGYESKKEINEKRKVGGNKKREKEEME